MPSIRLSKPMVVSFSGVDGAGKTTQIENLRSVAERLGMRVEIRAFWDNVVVLSRYRERFVQKVLKSESGVGAPGKPVNRRDKNVRGWHLNLLRHGLYGLDALHLPFVVSEARKNADLVIMDRYIVDELANLDLRNPLTRVYIRTVAAICPTPDITYILDADPELARARKPEYPLDFLRKSRQAYLELAQLLGNVTVIPPLSLPEAKQVVEFAFRRVLERRAGRSAAHAA